MMNPLVENHDYITINGVRSPGVARVTGAERVAKWDEQAGMGASGATLTYGGESLAEITVGFELWEDSHFLAWDAFSTFLVPPKILGMAKPIAYELRHPILDELRISAVVFMSRTQLTEDGETGKYKCTAKWKEYRAPKPIVGSANATGTIDKPKDADVVEPPNTQIDGMLQQLENEMGAQVPLLPQVPLTAGINELFPPAP